MVGWHRLANLFTTSVVHFREKTSGHFVDDVVFGIRRRILVRLSFDYFAVGTRFIGTAIHFLRLTAIPV